MNISLSKISFLNILFTALLFTVVIGSFLVIISNDSYEKKVETLEENYIVKNKELVKSEVKRTIKK